MTRVASIDEIIRATGNTAPTQTPVPLPSDNLNSDRNYFDVTISSVEYHDDKARRKFKKLEFKGMLLKFKILSNKEELAKRTSQVFANYVLEGDKESNKIWELYIQIPEISGILPQPSYKEVMDYKSRASTPISKEAVLKYENTTDRMPKFYYAGSNMPEISDIWTVSYHDENFLYYGLAHRKVGQIKIKIDANTYSDPVGGSSLGSGLSGIDNIA